MTVSIEMAHMAKSQPRKNQSDCSYLPQDYLDSIMNTVIFPSVFNLSFLLNRDTERSDLSTVFFMINSTFLSQR